MNIQQTSVHTFEDQAVLLDVREPAEWRAGHTPSAVHIPLGLLPVRLDDLPKAEVLDVAQLLLGSLDMRSITLPEKGAAAKVAEDRAATKAAEAPAKAEAATVEAEPEAKPEPKADAATAADSKPVTGLGIAGGAKRPGVKKAATPAEPMIRFAPR